MAGYGDDTAFQDWLTANGLTLPDGAPTPAVLRQRGSAYVDAVYGPKFCGAPTGGYDQERAWPRKGASALGLTIPDDVVPRAIVEASYRAAWLEATTPGWGSATVNPNQMVKRQKVDTIEREFFEAGGVEVGIGGIAAIDADIDGMLAPFLCMETGSGLGLWAVG